MFSFNSTLAASISTLAELALLLLLLLLRELEPLLQSSIIGDSVLANFSSPLISSSNILQGDGEYDRELSKSSSMATSPKTRLAFFFMPVEGGGTIVARDDDMAAAAAVVALQ